MLVQKKSGNLLNAPCKCLVKEAVGMKHVSSVGKIQREWMLFTSESKTSSYWKDAVGKKLCI